MESTDKYMFSAFFENRACDLGAAGMPDLLYAHCILPNTFSIQYL
jgi:hypothetical protein